MKTMEEIRRLTSYNNFQAILNEHKLSTLTYGKYCNKEITIDELFLNAHEGAFSERDDMESVCNILNSVGARLRRDSEGEPSSHFFHQLSELEGQFVEDLAEDALNEVCLFIQNKFGITDGFAASIFFSGEDGEKMQDIISRYIKYEIADAATLSGKLEGRLFSDDKKEESSFSLKK
jgi:hypothetical protein